MEPNTLLDAILDEAGISHAGLAARINQLGRCRGLALRYEHTAVARWLKGQRPRGQVPDLICEILGERLHRPVGLDDIGFSGPGSARASGTPLSVSSNGPPRCGGPMSSSGRTSSTPRRSPEPRRSSPYGSGRTLPRTPMCRATG